MKNDRLAKLIENCCKSLEELKELQEKIKKEKELINN